MIYYTVKKDNNIRPLGLRDGLINLTTKCVLKHLQKDTIKTFYGINYALAGPKKMDELIALIGHAFRAKPDHDRLFIDCTNAFNKIDRAEAAKAIIATCPKLTRYFYFLYQKNTNIWARNSESSWNTITGSQGGTQGCVMAPMVFGFGSLNTYRGIDTYLKDTPNSLFGAYLDDSVISAPHENTITAFSMFKADGPKHGLEINYGTNKTVVLLGKCKDDEETAQRIAAYVEQGIPLTNIKVHPENGGPTADYGYIHLGVPVGSIQYKYEHLHSLVDQFITDGQCDEIVKDAQAKWVYLLWVIRQKFPFWFRHMCPSITSTVEDKLETHMRNKFNSILGQPCTDKEWDQACLPTKTHGCGLGRPKDIITSAFASNIKETIEAVKIKLPAANTYLDLLNSPTDIFDAHPFESDEIMLFVRYAREKKNFVTEAATSLDELNILEAHDNDPNSKRKTQHFYSDLINRSRAKEMEELMLDHGSDVERARFLSNNGSLAGAWLFNVPKDKHSTMSTTEFRIALKLRLGVEFRHLLPRCCCPQRTNVCSNGIHLFSCNEMKPFLQWRHDAIQHDLLQLGHYAMKRVTDSGLGRMTEADGRKGDLLFAGMGKDNNDLVVDITIANPCCPTYLHHARDIEKYALTQLENNKIRKYQTQYHAVGVDFKPLAMEIFGATSDIFLKFLKTLAKEAAEINETPYSTTFSYWQKRISTTLQRYNAKVLQQSQYKIARVTGLLNDDHNDLNSTILNDRHIYDVVV